MKYAYPKFYPHMATCPSKNREGYVIWKGFLAINWITLSEYWEDPNQAEADSG